MTDLSHKTVRELLNEIENPELWDTVRESATQRSNVGSQRRVQYIDAAIARDERLTRKLEDIKQLCHDWRCIGKVNPETILEIIGGTP